MKSLPKVLVKDFTLVVMTFLALTSGCRKGSQTKVETSEPSGPLVGCLEQHQEACLRHQSELAALEKQLDEATAAGRVLDAMVADLKLSWNSLALIGLQQNHPERLNSYKAILDLQLLFIDSDLSSNNHPTECLKGVVETECSALLAETIALQNSLDLSALPSGLNVKQLKILTELNYRRYLVRSGLRPRGAEGDGAEGDGTARNQSANELQQIADSAIRGVRSSLRKISAELNSDQTQRLACQPAQEELCKEAKQTLVNLQNSLAIAIEAKDSTTARQLSAEINFQADLLDAYKAGHAPGSATVDRIDQKHAALEELFLSTPADLPAMPSTDTSLGQASEEPVSGAAHSPLSPREIVPLERYPYSDMERLAVNEVMRDFGELYIGPTGMRTETYPNTVLIEATQPRPWTSYYYPIRKNFMFGPGSPLAKFDRLVEVRQPTATAALQDKAVDWEKTNNFNEEAATWAGHCDAWVSAAMHTPEPLHSVTLEGIRFTSDDLKALRLKQFEGWRHSIYGNRYEGDASTYQDFQDLRPEAVHRIIEVVVGEQGQAIGIDSDPTAEIWNKPLYGMSYGVKPDPTFENAYYVYATARMVDLRRTPPIPFDSTNDQPITDQNVATNNEDIQMVRWEYRLFVDPEDQVNGKFPGDLW